MKGTDEAIVMKEQIRATIIAALGTAINRAFSVGEEEMNQKDSYFLRYRNDLRRRI